jgi:hypothetical protein
MVVLPGDAYAPGLRCGSGRGRFGIRVRVRGFDGVGVGVRGRGRIRTWDPAGSAVDHLIEAGSVLVVEPGNPHEVSCAGDEFCYVLTQSPKEQYDSVSYSAPEPVAS